VKKDQDVQTWDGVMQGDRLLTMSCSDKLARWNLLGVQGALLSYYLEPIYLHSVVLGSLFHPTHMYRAVSGRLRSSLTSDLPSLYKLHTPRLNLLSSREVRQPGRAPNHSVNWTTGDKEVEVVDAMKGKQDSGLPSRLCKVDLFKRWLHLAKENGLRRRMKVLVSDTEPVQYGEAKQGCTDFQQTKLELFKAFKKAELGSWVKKPMEQDEFEDSV
jgi:double stranded RNA-specific editase B